MNTDPSAIKILCYGDSNTWGQKPDKTGRFAADVRWTGVLQKKLGDKYYVIEEGLSSRTTDLEDPNKIGRNGKIYLAPCLESHNPIDVILIMLGTNDLKIRFDRTPEQIGSALNGIISIVKEFAKNIQEKVPKILLISPIFVNDKATRFREFYIDSYDATSAEKSQQLANVIARVAKDNGCVFVDASSVAAAGDDGIHFSQEAHQALGDKLAEELSS